MEIKTSFEIIGAEPLYNIFQLKRTVYYEDVINPTKYRDINICSCSSLEVAQKLLKIFEANPFTTEWLNSNRTQLSRRFTVCNPSKRLSKEYTIYGCTESKVKREEDFYNGTDQSVKFYQLMPDHLGKWSIKSKPKIICSLHSTAYIPKVVELWSIENGERFY